MFKEAEEIERQQAAQAAAANQAAAVAASQQQAAAAAGGQADYSAQWADYYRLDISLIFIQFYFYFSISLFYEDVLNVKYYVKKICCFLWIL